MVTGIESRLGTWSSILGAVFALATVVSYVFGDLRQFAPILFVLTVLAIAIALYSEWRRRLPPFTILRFHSELRLAEDPDVDRAILRHTLTLRPNLRGLRTFRYAHLACDGRATVKAVNPGVRVMEQRRQAGGAEVTVGFDHDLTPFKPVETWLELEVSDAFRSNPDFVGFRVDSPIQELVLDVVFRRDRSPLRATVTLTYAGYEHVITPYSGLPGPRISFSQPSTWYRRRIPYGLYRMTWWWPVDQGQELTASQHARPS